MKRILQRKGTGKGTWNPLLLYPYSPHYSAVGPLVGETPEVSALGTRVCVCVLGMGQRPVRVHWRVCMAGLAASPDKLSTKTVIHGGRWAL